MILPSPLSRDVQELLGRINASSQMAPDLHNIVREGLQAKQVSTEAANSYLKDLKKAFLGTTELSSFFGHLVLQKMCQPPVQH